MLTPDGYRYHARKMRKSFCENCGSTEATLCAHHKDGNWTNNDPSNIQTLCSSCHTSLHHVRGDIVTKQIMPPCKICGKPSYRSTEKLCNTHRTRWRRYGNPLLTRKRIGASWHLVMESGGLNGQELNELLREYPIGGTDLEPLAMDKYQQWLRQHGGC